MPMKDILSTLGVAAVTVAFTVAVLRPGSVGAVDETAAITPTIAQPELTLEGCVFTLSTDKPLYQAEESPTLIIKAVNTTPERLVTDLWLNMSASSPASVMSRRLVLPEPIWVRQLTVVLEPGETKTIRLETDTRLPVGQSIAIGLANSEEAMAMNSLNVPLPVNGTTLNGQAADMQTQSAIDLNTVVDRALSQALPQPKE